LMRYLSGVSLERYHTVIGRLGIREIKF
jgi:hypothetical protein